MKKAGKYALAAGLLVAFFLIPYEVHKHSAPEKSFAAVGDLPAPLSPHDSLIRMYADSIGWDWRLVAAVIRQESRFNSHVVSPGGAVGLMQIQSGKYSQQTLLDPEQNIRIGTRYLRKLEQMYSSGTRCSRSGTRAAATSTASYGITSTTWLRSLLPRVFVRFLIQFPRIKEVLPDGIEPARDRCNRR